MILASAYGVFVLQLKRYKSYLPLRESKYLRKDISAKTFAFIKWNQTLLYLQNLKKQSHFVHAVMSDYIFECEYRKIQQGDMRFYLFFKLLC